MRGKGKGRSEEADDQRSSLRVAMKKPAEMGRFFGIN